MDKKVEIQALCKKYGVKTLYAFGSVLTKEFNDKSDIDFLYTFEDNIPASNYADNLFSFIYDLENLLERKVDMVGEKYLKNKYFIEELSKTKQPIYGHKD